MTEFWFGALGLAALLMLILVFPLLRAPREGSGAVSEVEQNIDIFKDRLKELEAEYRNGVISQERFLQLKTELEAALIEDTNSLPGQTDVPYRTLSASQGRLLFSGLVVFCLGVAAAVYGKFGAYSGLAEALEFKGIEAQQTEHVSKAQINAMVASLEAKLKENPDNLDGWFLLARSYMNMERYAEAAEAYARAIPLVKAQNENPAPVYGLQAQATYFASQGRFTQEVRDLIDLAFEQEPNEPNTLGLLGMMAMQRGDFDAAIEFWSRILSTHPDHPGTNTILAAIEQAKVQKQRSAGGPPAESEQNEGSPQESVEGVTLTVQVGLSESLLERVEPTDTLFVYARAVNGPKMPLAIVRKTVAELPLTVSLSDGMAMTPAARLSNFDEVELVARVSKMGTPTPNPGDLEGTLSPVSTKVVTEEKYAILIDRQL